MAKMTIDQLLEAIGFDKDEELGTFSTGTTDDAVHAFAEVAKDGRSATIELVNMDSDKTLMKVTVRS
jgi:hypothetical protein